MVQITIKEVTYGKWGRCLEISNGEIDLVATLDFGPRIIRFGVVGGTNEFFEDINDELHVDGSEFDIYGDEGHWHIYGGHRLWTSPEALPRSYYPDNEPVTYTVIPNGVRLTPPPQAWNELQMELEVTITDAGLVNVVHKITNIGAWEAEFAAWTLTVMKIGGLEVIPQPKRETGLLGNRILALWPYTEMGDSRVNWETDFITLRPSAQCNKAFKFGINNEDGYAAYFNHGNLFIKRYSPVINGCYPDGGVSFETYTNNVMLEIETLGELKKVKPNETITHVETWELIPNVSEPESVDDIKTVLSEYIK